MASTLNLSGTALGTTLTTLLVSDDIQPGSEPSYQLCRTIYLHHPLGQKMAEAPISIAQSQQREITVPKSPGERATEAFQAEWKALGCDKHIFNLMRQSRIYGVASLAVLAEGVPTNRPLDLKALPNLELSFNVLDPLNTAGSLVLNQDPNALDFQKHRGIAVNGTYYHRSREVTILNEEPIYISYTSSGFGYVGRSVYQRALYPLKSFINTMVTDDMVTRKAGLLIAMIKQAGSIADQAMALITGVKRQLLKEAATNNVLSINPDEKIETLNMQNIDGAYGMARSNILKNIATAADMPAKLLENETLVEGFGEGTEDAKNIAKYVDRVREQMRPAYEFFDTIVMHRAWTPEFYKAIQKEFPDEYGKVGYTQAFYEWKNSFAAEWPSLLTEPESERAKAEETKYNTVLGVVETLMPVLDPENKATLVEWMADNLNQNKITFTSPLNLDYEALAEYEPPVPMMGGGAGGDDDEGEAPPKKATKPKRRFLASAA